MPLIPYLYLAIFEKISLAKPVVNYTHLVLRAALKTCVCVGC